MSSESKLVRIYPIGRSGREGEESDVDRVTVEEPLEIRVGGQTLAVTMRTPGNDFELAAGFLAAEGIVSRREEILKIEYCRDVRSAEEEGNVVIVRTTAPASGAMDRARRLLLTTSSCGLCGKGSIEALHGSFPPIVSNARLDPAVLLALPDRLRREQAAFRESGGLHGAGIFSLAGEPEVVREDVGRHNAVDKAIGTLFLAGRLPLGNSVLLVSGRASFEIVQKALAAGLPFVAAVSAPSSLAIDLASESGITLVAFLRRQTFNVYSRGIASRGAPALDEPREDPPEEHARKYEEPHGYGESEPDGKAREGGHGRPSGAGRRWPVLKRSKVDEDEERRYSSAKAVAAAFILFGLILAALFIFVVVLIQRAC